MVQPMKLRLRPGPATTSATPAPTSASPAFILFVPAPSGHLPKQCRRCVLHPCLDPASPATSE
uniref:Predicted protein n=1 Tax=Hordeum vulgare subsp. vulgare TaxID=112509 RepID=F2DBT0_HORVV|nr:predicted protein [Hordeum vulgare subsp. vulgare]